ncbi:MAG: 5-oxoprolinase subunit PxpB [Clostridiales bacterium]|nr:5-oxoprolinase subunit PxpB [Clostridiales bacterium]
METATLKVSGDRAILVEFENRIAPEVNRLVRSFTAALEEKCIPGIVEIVPAYCAVTVHYRPEEILFDGLKAELSAVLGRLDEMEIPPATVWEIPVLYGGEEGPDIGFVAEHSGLSEEEVVRIHSGSEYLVYMLGFTPGFPYLGGMSPAIAAPRLKAPRLSIPAGSVGIAGQQTGVYPIASPGGWQLIGRTPVKLYDPGRETPVLVKAGDYVKFTPVGAAEFARIAAGIEAGSYRCRTWQKEG